MPPTERRRAPDTVAVALEAALAACRSANLSPASLPCVFSSMHGDLAITISIGYTCLSHAPFDTAEKFFEAADSALYAAKQRGRNCVASFTDRVSIPKIFSRGRLSQDNRQRVFKSIGNISPKHGEIKHVKEIAVDADQAGFIKSFVLVLDEVSSIPSGK